MEVTFKMEKVTKNTIRFEEVLKSDLDAPKVGSIYIPKSTLSEIGWEEGKDLIIEIKEV